MAATDALCRSFLDLWWHFDPGDATAGRLGDFGPEAVRQHVAALRAIAAAVEELDVEGTGDEIDRTALLDHIRVRLFRLEHEHPYRTNPLLWTEHLVRSFVLPPPDTSDALAAAAALERLRGVPAFCRSCQDSIRKPPALLASGALDQLDRIPGLLTRARTRYASRWAESVADPAALLAEARSGLGELRTALEEQIVPDRDPHAGAIGAAEADRRLHYEHASIHNAGEVWRNALRLAAEVEEEVTALAAALDPARPWRELYHAVAGAPLSPAGATSAFAAFQEEARRFARAQGLVPEEWAASVKLEPEPPDDPLARPEGELVSGESGPAKLMIGSLPAGALPWLAARLGEPGALLLDVARQALPGLVRRHITASSTTGGWELYAQELMAELGYRPEPESRLVERVLFLQDVHLALVDVGLHTRQLTTEEALAHLSGRVPLPEGAPAVQVRRMLTFPLGACAALLGRQELRRLREDCRAARGDAFSVAEFHRELFGYGGLPIPLIRWGMGLDA